MAPCCNFDSCPDDKTEQTADHEKGDEDCGNCSPFFSCEGCATATIAYQPIQFDFTLFISTPKYAGYILVNLPQPDFDFWQPPQLG